MRSKLVKIKRSILVNFILTLSSIRDNYEKIVLSLEPGLDASYDGIKSENLIDWLLDE